MRNYLTIAGRDSRDFGVYISGQGTFSAPEKAYQFYEVPGRNGDIIGYDHRLMNIEVSYECFIYANFSQNIADFRTFLLSLNGYQKLTDSYHPDEYRMAAYVGPFEPEVTAKNDAGAFTLTFNCKPQRFLTSGDASYSWVPGGDTAVSGAELFAYAPKIDASFCEWSYSRHQDAEYITQMALKIKNSNAQVTAYQSALQDSTACSIDLITGLFTQTGGIIHLPKTGWKLNLYNPNVFYWAPSGGSYKVEGAVNSASHGFKVFDMNDIDFFTSERGITVIYTQTNVDTIQLRDIRFATAAQLEAFLASNDLRMDITWTTPKTEQLQVFSPNWGAYITDLPTITVSGLHPNYESFSLKYMGSDFMSNPTMFPSEPLIRVYGTGSFVMDGVTVTITDCNQYVDIDCELMDCYEGSTNRNNDVTFSTYDFPKLQPGDNAINIISGITAVEITPRWWRV